MSEIIRRFFKGDIQLLQRPFALNSQENIAFEAVEQQMETLKQQIPSEFHPSLTNTKPP